MNQRPEWEREGMKKVCGFTFTFIVSLLPPKPIKMRDREDHDNTDNSDIEY